MPRIECRGRSSQVSLETFSRKTTNNLETKDEKYCKTRSEVQNVLASTSVSTMAAVAIKD